MMTGGQLNSDDKIGNRIMSLMLLTCYNLITIDDTKEVVFNS